MFPVAVHDIEYEFVDNIPAMYANIRAFNRWMLEEVGYVAENRMFLPPFISLADPDLAVEGTGAGDRRRAPMIQIKAGHAHGGRRTPLVVGRRPIRSTIGSGRSPTRPRYGWPSTWVGPTIRSTGRTGRRTPRRVRGLRCVPVDDVLG